MPKHTVHLTLAQLVSIIGEQAAIETLLENHDGDIADNLIEYRDDQTFDPSLPMDAEIEDMNFDSSRAVGDHNSARAEFSFTISMEETDEDLDEDLEEEESEELDD